MADVYYEYGIGEMRALWIDDNEVRSALAHWDDDVFVGRKYLARLVSRRTGNKRGLARTRAGLEILLDSLPADASEGKEYEVRIQRAAIAERGRLKRARGRIISDDAPLVQADLGKHLVFTAGEPQRRFPSGTWEEVWSLAAEGELAFPGGKILLCATPAMTLIDIDGDLSPRELGLAAIPAIAKALRWLDIGGSIGIDFPTLSAKQDRKELDKALEAALANWPHERTAMNGFGFVQIVARLDGPSLLHRLTYARAASAARFLLRRAEQLEGTGGRIELSAHPAVIAELTDEWLTKLRRRTGREVVTRADPNLAIVAPHAQLVPL